MLLTATAAILGKSANKVASCQEQDRDCKTPLIYAALSGNLETFNVVFNCFDNKVEICNQEVSNNGTILLHHAVQGGNAEIVQLVLGPVVDKEAACLKQDNFGKTPLYHAALSGNLKIFNVVFNCFDNKVEICNQELDDNGTILLHHAVQGGNAEIARLVLDLVVDKKAACLKQNIQDSYKKIPLYHVALGGNLETFNVIFNCFDNKVEVCTQEVSNDGTILLHCAAEGGNAEIVQLVLDPVVDKEAVCLKRNNSRRTPLHYAATSGHVGAINKILDHITDKKSICQGDTPTRFPSISNRILDCAWKSGSTDAVKAILYHFDDKQSAWNKLRNISSGKSSLINREEIERYVNM